MSAQYGDIVIGDDGRGEFSIVADPRLRPLFQDFDEVFESAYAGNLAALTESRFRQLEEVVNLVGICVQAERAKRNAAEALSTLFTDDIQVTEEISLVEIDSSGVTTTPEGDRCSDEPDFGEINELDRRAAEAVASLVFGQQYDLESIETTTNEELSERVHEITDVDDENGVQLEVLKADEMHPATAAIIDAISKGITAKKDILATPYFAALKSDGARVSQWEYYASQLRRLGKLGDNGRGTTAKRFHLIDDSSAVSRDTGTLDTLNSDDEVEHPSVDQDKAEVLVGVAQEQGSDVTKTHETLKALELKLANWGLTVKRDESGNLTTHIDQDALGPYVEDEQLVSAALLVLSLYPKNIDMGLGDLEKKVRLILRDEGLNTDQLAGRLYLLKNILIDTFSIPRPFEIDRKKQGESHRPSLYFQVLGKSVKSGSESRALLEEAGYTDEEINDFLVN